jgi:uncharacterized membrane protein
VTDQHLETIIGNLLRVGVSLSAAIVFAGGVWYLATYHGSIPDYRDFQPVVRGLGAITVLPRPLALIEIGLIVLIATPVARVIFSLIGFAIERDWMYVGITSIVLAILLYSIGTAWF